MTRPVMTVTGPVEPDRIGGVLVHEHIHMAAAGSELDPTAGWDRESTLALAVARMRRLRELGIDTVVDPTPVDLGRDPGLLREVAERSGINIVSTTGFHAQTMGIPYYWRQRSVDEIADFFVHELTDGIGSDVLPGVVKVATSSPVSDLERKVARAAAQAALRTGAPVITHTEASRHGDEQLAILRAAGVPPSRCLIGHQEQVDGAVAVAGQGAFVGVDRVGMRIFGDDDARAALVRDLLAAGYADRVCLSQDHSCSIRGFKPPADLAVGDRRRYLSEVWPRRVEDAVGRGYEFLLLDFLPRLAALGAPREQIDALISTNPRRWLAGE